MSSTFKLNDYTVKGNCSSCGECCSDILHLDKDEIEKIDKYLKKHKISQHNKGKNNIKCPFRNETFKKCDIYEVRPYICQIFKCNIPPELAKFNRDEINKGKKPRSMAELFFKDDSKIKFLKKYFNLKVYKREE